MAIIPFPTSGLANLDLRTIDRFCAQRREQGVALYLAVCEIDDPGKEYDGLKYATIMDQYRGKTVYIIEKTDAVYRVRYFHTVDRAAYVIAEGRSLQKVLSETPEWPVTPTRDHPSRRRPE